MSDTVIWVGAGTLRQYLSPIDDIEPWADNPRQGDVMALVGSLRRFGQVRACTSRGDRPNALIAGHHLRLAAKELGWTHVAVIPAEFKSDDEAEVYGLADNELGRLGGFNEQKQYEVMERLQMFDPDNLQGTGITIDRAEDIIAAAGKVPESTMPEGSDLARGHAENAQAAAERAATLAASKAMKESVLMLTQEQAKEFGQDIKILEKAWEMTSLVKVVLRAVHEAAASQRDAAGGLVAPAESKDQEVTQPDHPDLQLPEEAYPTQEEVLFEA